MKIRKFFPLLLAIVLFFTFSVPVAASPYQQDPQDALIRQVLKATIDELGWNASMIGFTVTEYGPRYITEDHDYIDTAYIGVIPYDSENAAKNAYYDRLSSSSMQEFEFHGYPAAISAGTMWVLMERFFVFVQAELGEVQARNSLDAFYRNAVAYGLISGDPGLTTPVPGTTTLAPEMTVTPEQGGFIVLKASLDGYGEATQTISNAENYEVIIIEGKVVDQEGKGVGGANVEVVSGANPAAISTNADGAYSLVLNISGGQGNGSLGGVIFTLQLEGDLAIAKIELVQAVSGAELADSKHTAALVFPRFSSQAQSSVDTKVTLYVNGQLFKTLPFRVKNNYSADEHRKVYDALKFFIPPSFVRTGVFEVRAVIDPENTFVEPDEANNEKTFSQIVSPSRGLSVVMVALSPDVSIIDAQNWAIIARRFLANTYPVPAVRIVQHPVYSNGWWNLVMALRDAAIVNNARVAYNAANPGSKVEYAVGLYPPNSYGAGNRGFVYRLLYPQAPLVSLEFPITIAHEIGHVHLGGHEEVDDNPNLGGVSLPEGYVYDYITGQVRYIKPNSNWINFMGDPYAGHELGGVTVRPWVSPTASNTILGVRQSATGSESKVASLTVPSWSAAEPFEKVLYISGYFDNGELKVSPPQTLNTNLVGGYPTGEYMASMQAADGSVLANVSFGVNHDLGEYDAPNPGAFQIEIPYPEEALRFVITKDGQEFYRLEKSANAPTVTVDQPGSGNLVDGATTVTWSAADEDGDTLTYNVYYSPDGGASWQLIGLGWNSSSIPMDGSLLPGSDHALIRVVASDGLNIGQADSPSFVVPKHPPVITILPPDQDSEPWITGHPNLLAATADDIEDGLLSPEAYQWSSDIDGVLGQGNALYVALSEGKHTITVTVTDNDGQQVSESTTIMVRGTDNNTPLPVSTNILYLIAGGTCMVMLICLVIGGAIFFSFKRRQTTAQSQLPGQIQDSQGYWWHQDPKSGVWSVWNGRAWEPATTLPPPAKAPMQVSKQRSGSSCLLTLFMSGLMVLLVFSAVSVIGLNFIPGLTIQPVQNATLIDILKMAGGGLLLGLLGSLTLWGGIKSILARRAVIEDEWRRRSVKRGCSAVLSGILQTFFGLLLLLAGSGLMALSLYQQVLPWLGIEGITLIL
jgi:hypothetical protein